MGASESSLVPDYWQAAAQRKLGVRHPVTYAELGAWDRAHGIHGGWKQGLEGTLHQWEDAYHEIAHVVGVAERDWHKIVRTAPLTQATARKLPAQSLGL